MRAVGPKTLAHAGEAKNSIFLMIFQILILQATDIYLILLKSDWGNFCPVQTILHSKGNWTIAGFAIQAYQACLTSNKNGQI